MKNIYLDMQPTWAKKAGIGWYTYKIAERLVENNKNNYIGGLFNPCGIRKVDKVKNLKYKEIKYFWPYFNYFGVFNKKFFKWKFLSFNLITKTNCDIYHFFNFVIPDKINGKIITTVHDTIHKVMPENVNFNVREFDEGIKKSLEKSDVIVTVSNSAKEDIIKYYGKKYENKIKIVEPGVNLDKYKQEFSTEYTEEILFKLGIKKNDEFMFTIGTLQKRKNILNIIRAFNRYKENNSKLKLVIAGNPGDNYQEIINEYNSSKYKNDIKILNYISEEEKIVLYKNAKIFIFPSLYEGFGMPIVEAMAAGISVITSNISSMPEVLGDAGILVNPYSIEEISKAIEKYDTNEKLRKESVEKGYIQCQKFTWENSAKKLEKIYKEM